MRLAAIFFLLQTFAGWSTAQTSEQGPETRHGTVQHIKVHGKGLESNLEGDSPDRNVSVYLPPSYNTERNRRYPVVYMLHGFTDSDAKWFGLEPHWINVANVIDKALASQAVREMLIVMPDAYTRYQGSMYSNSVTTGNWEDFVARELVAYIDGHYRTIPQAASRGLTGHSMGGYGTIRIGMKHAEIFSSLYLLSPCCMAPMNSLLSSQQMTQIEAITTPEQVQKANFGTKAMFAAAAAWAPNPKNPPLFLDLPFQRGEARPLIAAKFSANAPLAVIDQFIPNLRQLHAIAFDAGTKDKEIAANIGILDEVLNRYEIQHTYETYDGTHISRIAERIETKTLPFFSKTLSFDETRR
jgi:enterochelin esterase-like enzyme